MLRALDAVGLLSLSAAHLYTLYRGLPVAPHPPTPTVTIPKQSVLCSCKTSILDVFSEILFLLTITFQFVHFDCNVF